MTWTLLGIGVLVFLSLCCYMGYRRGFVKEVVSTLFILLSIALVWVVNPYVNEFIRKNTSIYEVIQENCKELVENQLNGETGVGEEQQYSVIEGMNLPELLRTGLETNNTAEVYRYLAVNTFGEYVAGYLALVVVNGLSFLVSFLLVTILIRLLTFALSIIANLPVLRGVNKLAGAFLGGAKAILFIWVAMLILTVLCNTKWGMEGLKMIERDTILSFLYENNIFVKVFMSIFYGK